MRWPIHGRCHEMTDLLCLETAVEDEEAVLTAGPG